MMIHSWKIVTEETFMNQDRIFPLQQRDVLKLVKHARADENIHKIIIFGSSVTAQCNPWSDLDVYFEQDSDSPHFSFADLESPVDFWNNFTVDASLLAEIKEKGVIVYER